MSASFRETYCYFANLRVLNCKQRITLVLPGFTYLWDSLMIKHKWRLLWKWHNLGLYVLGQYNIYLLCKVKECLLAVDTKVQISGVEIPTKSPSRRYYLLAGSGQRASGPIWVYKKLRTIQIQESGALVFCFSYGEGRAVEAIPSPGSLLKS